ncbi:hypothetical protein FRC20_005564 [Serendipita sp. 405]|nr:hypothetical protein FRC20_005564 [Serendipita sp. 405]
MASTTPYKDLINLVTESETIDSALLHDISDRAKVDNSDGTLQLANALKERFDSSDTAVRTRVLIALDALIVDCGPDFWDALVQCGFFVSLAIVNRDDEIHSIIPEYLKRWKVEMGADYEAIINELLLGEATGNADLITRRPVGGMGQFRRKPIKPLAPFLTIAYLRALRVLEVARKAQTFHMQAVYIARQALHLVILLNDTLEEEELSDEDEDERLYLEDELQQLDVAIRRWGTEGMTVSDYPTRISDIQDQYRLFFRSRFYYDHERDPQNDKLYNKLLAYDRKTIEMRELKKEYGNVVMDDQDVRVTQPIPVPGGAFIESVNSSPAMTEDAPLNQVSVTMDPNPTLPVGVTEPPSEANPSVVDTAPALSPGDDMERARQYRNQQKDEEPVSQTFKCPVPGCDKSFDKQYLLRHHIREHDDRPYRCPMRDCDRRFATPTEQRVHEALHRIKNMGIIPNMPAFSPPIVTSEASQQPVETQPVESTVEEVKSDEKQEDVKSEGGQPHDGGDVAEDGKGKQPMVEEELDDKGKGKPGEGDNEGLQTAISRSMNDQEVQDTEEEMVRQAVTESLKEPRDENQGTSGTS